MASSTTNWESLWGDDSVLTRWQEPYKDLVNLVPILQSAQYRRVLDLGCGAGRHIILFARSGFETYGIEETESGLSHCREWLKRLGLTAHLIKGDMSDLGQFETGFFDIVVCWHVIYHARLTKMVATLKEIHRVIRPGGLLYITFNSTNNKHYGQGTEIEPNTFIGAKEKLDGEHVHHYSTRDEIHRLLDEFTITSVQEKEDTIAGQTFPETYHWHVIAQKLG